MTRSLKSIGLAFIAALALGAITAQAAKANVEHTFNSEVSPTVLTGTFHPLSVAKFSRGALSIECTSAKFEGTQAGKTADTVTFTATYGSTTKPSNCTESVFGTEAIIHTDHCALVFESDTVATPDSTEHAPAEIECAGGTENKSEITIPAFGITLTIGAQNTIKDGAVFTNIGAGSTREVTVHTTTKSLIATCMGANCSLVGLKNEVANNEFEFNGTQTIAGFEDCGSELKETAKTTPTFCDGKQVGFFVTTP